MISVVSPSIRTGALDMLAVCLQKQSFQDFEWIIVTPLSSESLHTLDLPVSIIQEPEKRKGDFYNLNKAWNKAFQKANGELIVSIVDQTWIPNDCLEILWNNYEANPKGCISATGHQYEDSGNQEPEVLVWRDPRARDDLGSFYETFPTEMEFCVASVPRQAIIDCGGVDETFDQYAALSEKEMMARIEKLGYQLFIDQSIQYKAIHHPRLHGKEAWDTHYFQGCAYYDTCIREIIAGKRKKLDNRSWSTIIK